MPKPQHGSLRHWYVLEIERIKLQLDSLILATPTGEARNALTEANIHLIEAQQMLEKGGHERKK